MSSSDSKDSTSDWKKLSGHSPTRQGALQQAFDRATSPPQKGTSKTIIPSKQRIELLKKKLSRPTLLLAPSPCGIVQRSYEPDKNRKIMHEIKAIRAVLAKQQCEMRRSYTKASMEGTAKQSFNDAAKFEM